MLCRAWQVWSNRTSAASPARPSGRAHGAGAASAPPIQAEELLQESLAHSRDAIERLSARTDGWRGRLTLTPRLAGLLDLALNSEDLAVRIEGLELELAIYDLSKTVQSANQLIARIKTDSAARPWGLWMLGAMGNRGIEPERALATQVTYSHDPDETTRYWVVAGISLLGTDAAIQPMLDILRNDPSMQVREGAGCGLLNPGC